MKSKLSASISAVIGAIAFTMSANAAIVDSGVLSITIPQNIDGIYYNVVTGANAATGAAATGWDINLYQPSATFGISFFWPTATTPPSSGGVATGTVYDSVPAGTVIGPASNYSNASGGGGAANFVNFITAGPKTIGLRFLNEAGSTVHYGYINVTTSGPLGFPAVITRIVYDNAAGTPVTAGALGASSTFSAVTAPGNIALSRELPATTSTRALSFNVTGAAGALTCATTSPGYSVTPAPLNLVVGTPGSVTVTHTGSVAGTFTGTVTCTGPAGSAGGPFVYNFTTTVAQARAAVPALNAFGALLLLAGFGLFGALSVRRYS